MSVNNGWLCLPEEPEEGWHLTYMDGYGHRILFYCHDAGMWLDDEFNEVEDQPSYHQPLPEPPQ